MLQFSEIKELGEHGVVLLLHLGVKVLWDYLNDLRLRYLIYFFLVLCHTLLNFSDDGASLCVLIKGLVWREMSNGLVRCILVTSSLS